MKITNFATVFLQCFIGFGACAGGLSAVMNPVAPLGIPPETLEHSPFETFLVPGLFLLIVIGLGNIFSFLISKIFTEARGYLSGFMGIMLVLWIIIQCIFLRAIAPLHVIFFVLGVVQGLLALKVIFALSQWPYYDIKFFIARHRHRIRDNQKNMNT